MTMTAALALAAAPAVAQQPQSSPPSSDKTAPSATSSASPTTASSGAKTHAEKMEHCKAVMDKKDTAGAAASSAETKACADWMKKHETEMKK
jgi:hypothetical protein